VDFTFAFDFRAFPLLLLLPLLVLMVPYILHKYVFWFLVCSFLKALEPCINFTDLTTRWRH